jgi:hypothetical protein
MILWAIFLTISLFLVIDDNTTTARDKNIKLRQLLAWMQEQEKDHILI